MRFPSVSILIPAYNDEETVASVILKADTIAKKITRTYEIMVINDASRDGTGDVLNNLLKKYPQLTVLTHTVNQGYGGTIQELYKT